MNFELMTRHNCSDSIAPRQAELPTNHHSPRTPALSNSSAVLRCSDMKGFGIVVPNANASVQYFAEAFGQSVPTLRTTGATEYKGQASTAEALFGQLLLSNDLFLHVYQPVGTASSWWYDGLQQYGPSVHLASFGVPDLDAAVREFGERGYRVLQKGGDSWVFMDTIRKLGVVVEIFGTGGI